MEARQALPNGTSTPRARCGRSSRGLSKEVFALSVPSARALERLRGGGLGVAMIFG